MNFHIPLPPRPQHLPRIAHSDRILLIGSCFTEHISSRLAHAKIPVLANPHGILFNPLSVSRSLRACLENRRYTGRDLFFGNEIWSSWDFHSRFSHTDADAALKQMNDAVEQGGAFLKTASWLIVTLGSAFQYFLKTPESTPELLFPVANCHRAPATSFERHLLPVAEMTSAFEAVLGAVRKINPALNIIFTVSPVRHIREGIIENNRSKARLIETVHALAERIPGCFYFPAYEMLIDVLRDYRFYDVDMAHPNYQATQYIWEQFEHYFFDEATRALLAEIQEIRIAYSHHPRFPETEAHRKFTISCLNKIQGLKKKYPSLDFSREIAYFSGGKHRDP